MHVRSKLASARAGSTSAAGSLLNQGRRLKNALLQKAGLRKSRLQRMGLEMPRLGKRGLHRSAANRWLPSGRSRKRSVLRGVAAGAVASTLAAALFVRKRTREVERRHPPAGRFIEVDGVRLHYVEYGEGPPLVLLHGNYGSALDFELSGLVERAALYHRVVVFDRPGFGYSSRPRNRIWGPQSQAALMQRAMQRLGIERPVVLGHSWGAMVALALALDHPAAVRSLVLQGGYCYPTPRGDSLVAAPLALPLVGDVFAHSFAPIELRLMWPMLSRLMFAPNEVTPSFERYPGWMAARPVQLRASAVEQAMSVPAAMALQDRYASLQVPVVIVHGTGDRMVHADTHAERLHAELPDSRLVLVDDMGHMLHHVVPDVVMECIAMAADAPPRMDAAPVVATLDVQVLRQP